MNNEVVEEKKNNTNKILIAIIIILLLSLGGLSYYTFFVKDKEIDKPNANENNNTTELEELVNGFDGLIENWNNYSNTEFKSLKALSNEQILFVISSKNKFDNNYKIVTDFIRDNDKNYEYYKKQYEGKKDSDGVIYKFYNDDNEKLICSNHLGVTQHTKGQIRLMLMSMNFTVQQIEKIDFDAYKCWYNGGFAGGTERTYAIMSGSELKSKIISLFGTDNGMFEKSFSYGSYTYDKNLNVVFIENDGSDLGPGGYYFEKTHIVNSNKNDNNLKIDFILYNFSCDSNENNKYKCEFNNNASFTIDGFKDQFNYYQLDDNNALEVAENYVAENQNDFDNYIITFKIVDGYYQFDNIVKK